MKIHKITPPVVVVETFNELNEPTNQSSIKACLEYEQGNVTIKLWGLV